MIAHLVLFRFKPGVAAGDGRVEDLVRNLDALPGKIPAIKSWQHGFNVTADADAWDYGLRAVFDSEADLHAYFDHPAHLPVAEQCLAIADLAFADFAI
jgi:hypothetical protein